MDREISELEILKFILVKNISDLIEEFIADSMTAEVHEYLKWLIKKTHYLRLQKVFNPTQKGKLNRGDILLADFGFNVGSEIRKIRYCIVLDVNNPVNHGSVVVVLITTFGGSQKKKIPQSCIYIGALKGLGKMNNYANVGEIRAISKQRIIKVIGRVPNEVMLNVTRKLLELYVPKKMLLDIMKSDKIKM